MNKVMGLVKRVGSKFGAVVALSSVSAVSLAQAASGDPTTTITSTLAGYLPDVLTIVTATLLIVYGKKVYSYLK